MIDTVSILPAMGGGFGGHRSVDAGSATRPVAEGLTRSAWDEPRREIERKDHPAKVRIAQSLRRETTTTLPWIADRLKLGTSTHVSFLLRNIETPRRKTNEKRRELPF